MTQLNDESIHKLTELSRIRCSEKERESLLGDLQEILRYIEQLQQIDTADSPPCDHVLEDIVNVMRDDIVGETMPRDLFLSNAPEQIAGLIRVPTVINSRKK